MQLSLLLLLAFFSTTTVLLASDCNKKCEETEYESYVKCLRKRIKRSTECGNSVQDSCTDCDCNFCVVNTCPGNCGKCCESQPPCESKKCCHKTCHSRCKSTSCRTDCRKNCVEMLITDGFNITIPDRPKHNITTIIHLRNTINNTNIVDAPVQVNSTNVNNITIEEREEKAESKTENCCYIISPRKCAKLEKYPYAKCVHYRRKACGTFCVSPVLYEQTREVCVENATGGEICREQKVYIPQQQPRCMFQPVWPYIMCRNIAQQFCGGCYQPTNYHFPPPSCPYHCHSKGPNYHQGPFYRPGFSQIPSCYQTGTCRPNPSYGNPMMQYPPKFYPNSSLIYHPQGTLTKLPEIKVQFPPPSFQYPVPMFPPYISTGYQYPPQRPIYILPPEVDIQAVITHPEKTTTYAQITINKSRAEKDQSAQNNKTVNIE